MHILYAVFAVTALGVGMCYGRFPAGGRGGPKRVTPLCPSDYELQPMPVATDMLTWLEQKNPPRVMVIDIHETLGQRPHDISQVIAWLWALHKRGEVSVALYSGHSSRKIPIQDWIQDFNAYLLIADSGERVDYFLQNNIDSSIQDIRWLLNPLAHLVIVLSKISTSHQEYLNSTRMSLKAAWMYHRSLYAVVLTVNEDGDWMRVFADPLHRPSDLAYSDILPVYTYDTEWSVFKTYPLNADLPPDVISNEVGKRRKDLNMAGFPIVLWPATDRTVTVEFDYNKQRWKYEEGGDDTRSLFHLSEYLNFQIVEDPLDNGIHNLLIHSYNLDTIVEKTNAYIIMNRYIPEIFQHTRGRYLERSLEMAKYKIVVPRAMPLPLWSLPMRVFGMDIWVGLMMTMVVYAVTWRVVTGESPLRCVAATLRAFSSCGGPPQERITSLSQRLQLAGALLASSVVIAAAYQGRLYTLMTDPDYGEEINSIEDIGKANIPMLLVKTAFPPNPNSSDMVKYRTHKVRLEYVYAYDMDTFIKKAAEKDYKASFSVLQSEIIPMDILYNSAFERLRFMKNYERTVYMGLVTSRRNPWHSEINNFLLLCEETGLRIRWKRDARASYFRMFRKMEHFNLYENTKPDEEDIKPFVLADLTPHFQMLISGLVVSLIVLVYEQYKEGNLKRYRLPIFCRKRKL